MDSTAQILLALGGIFLLGLATDLLGQRTFLPRVTLLLLFGILIGDEVLDLIPASIDQRFALTDVRQAHESLEARATTGCTILLP